MFIFYYAVLSEVSPPTALSPFAAAALTGANPYRTTLQSWKYTLPAFVVPLMFVLDPAGIGLLLKGAPAEAVLTVTTAVLGVAALAAGVQNWLFACLVPAERLPLVIAGLLLGYPGPWSDAAGLVMATIVGVAHWIRTREPRTA
jgi:TRAP-type uncharacterized transport system fused permease subunit